MQLTVAKLHALPLVMRELAKQRADCCELVARLRSIELSAQFGQAFVEGHAVIREEGFGLRREFDPGRRRAAPDRHALEQELCGPLHPQWRFHVGGESIDRTAPESSAVLKDLAGRPVAGCA